jgi:hypothetical protein
MKLLVVLLVAGGCDKCKQSDPNYCDGNTLRYCSINDQDSGDWHWFSTSCPVACRQASDGATCVDSPTPVPECAATACSVGVPNSCWKGLHTECHGGYPTKSTPCQLDLQCVVVGDCPNAGCSTAFCLPSPSPASCQQI